MKCPPGGLQACKVYHNFKNFYSIVLMAMVDSHYRFVWDSCGFSGSSHDAVTFRSTHLWTHIQEGFIYNYLISILGVGQFLQFNCCSTLFVSCQHFPFHGRVMKHVLQFVIRRLKFQSVIIEGTRLISDNLRQIVDINNSGCDFASTFPCIFRFFSQGFLSPQALDIMALSSSPFALPSSFACSGFLPPPTLYTTLLPFP